MTVPLIQIAVGLPLFLLLLHLIGTAARVLISTIVSILDFFVRVFNWLDYIDELTLLELLPFPLADMAVGLGITL